MRQHRLVVAPCLPRLILRHPLAPNLHHALEHISNHALARPPLTCAGRAAGESLRPMTRGSGWRRVGWLSGVLALSCGGGEDPAPVAEPVIAAPVDELYEVHEWGLIVGSTELEGARALTAPLTASGGSLGQLGNPGGVLHGTGGIGSRCCTSTSQRARTHSM